MKGNVLARHERRLEELATEIKECHAEAVTAQQAAVKQAAETGRKLRLAHRLLARLKTKRGRKGLRPPPTWKKWVEANCQLSVRTAYYYMKVHKHFEREECKWLLIDPHASIRRIVRMIARHAGEDGEGGQGEETCHGEEGGHSDAERSDGPGEESPTDHERELRDVCKRFRELVGKWPEGVVSYLAQEAGDLEQFLGSVRAAVEPLVRVWREATKKVAEEEARPSTVRLPAGYEKRRRAKRRASLERAARGREAFRMEVWSQVQGRLDLLDAYQKGKVVQWVEGANGLTPRDRRRLARLEREVSGADDPDERAPNVATPPFARNRRAYNARSSRTPAPNPPAGDRPVHAG